MTSRVGLRSICGWTYIEPEALTAMRENYSRGSSAGTLSITQ